jgi:hypothetical protein
LRRGSIIIFIWLNVNKICQKTIFILKNIMAKKQGKSSGTGIKISFGVRKGGKHRKSQGPKDKPVSKYRGQGK